MYICKVINNEKLKVMKALTTSELNQVLMSKGFNQHNSNDLPKNKWGADYFTFTETDEGISYLGLYVNVGQYISKRIIKYNQMKALDKKEFTTLVLGY